MGRPRKALSEQKGNRTKAEIADRKYQEEESKVNHNLVLPNWLNEKARDIFENIVVELNEKKLLDNLDIPLLAIYSDSYARLQELTNIIDSHGYTINKMTKLGVVVVKNPNVDTLKLLQKTVLDYAVRLGLNSIDRTKLITNKPPEEEEDPFEAYIK